MQRRYAGWRGGACGSVRWRRRAQDLADSINRHCWDERDGTFYSPKNDQPVEEAMSA